MENYEEEILKRIDEDVRSNADLIEETIKSETAGILEEQITRYRQGLEKETETYLEKQLGDLRLSTTMNISQGKMETRKKLLLLRKERTDELFDSVKEQLVRFTATDAYRDYLKTHLEEVELTDKGEFFCRKDDKEILESLLKEKAFAGSVSEGFFEIGGFVYRDRKQGIEYSCVLDEKLSEQRDRFRKSSGFRIPESEECV